MKKLILFLLLCGFWCYGAQAQSTSDDISIEQVTGAGEQITFTDDDLLNQFAGLTGISNLQWLAADANQTAHINLSGSSNHANIIQAGSGNIGGINITGNYNTSTLQQNGTDLLSLIHIEGHSNRLEVNQNGNNLGNLVQVLGAGLDVDITQDAAGFRYAQNGAAIPITLTTTARNVPVVIRNNQY